MSRKVEISNFGDAKVPYLVLLSGRTREDVEALAKDVEENYNNAEYIRHLYEIFDKNNSEHRYRGYFIKNEKNQTIKRIENVPMEKRQIWFVFTGLGCQWPGMAKNLMKIPIFAESISKSHRILESKGLDLFKIIIEEGPSVLDNNIVNVFVGITAVQIALVDIMSTLEIVPHAVIGHSLGELACGYADGCLTAEEALLGAYCRASIFTTDKYSNGLIAVIGQDYHILKEILPPEVDIACYNSPQNYSISGPADSVKAFMDKMRSQGVFVKEADTCGIAFHSRCISQTRSELLSRMREVIPNPRPRSKRWICTSAPENEWNSEEIKHASPEYYVNNLLNPVFFLQGMQHMPKNAITLEIAPHAISQAAFNIELPPTITNIALSSKNHEDNVMFLLEAIGKLYIAGMLPKMHNLYPPSNCEEETQRSRKSAELGG